MKGLGKGDIIADVEYQGSVTRICLTKVMHVPGADGKILSLRVLDEKGFQSHIEGGKVHITRQGRTYTKATLGGELYEVKMKIIPSSEETVLAAVKRDASATNLSTWHRHLGHLGNTILQKLVGSNIVKGMVIMDNNLSGICEDCILGKMDKKPFGV